MEEELTRQREVKLSKRPLVHHEKGKSREKHRQCSVCECTHSPRGMQRIAESLLFVAPDGSSKVIQTTRQTCTKCLIWVSLNSSRADRRKRGFSTAVTQFHNRESCIEMVQRGTSERIPSASSTPKRSLKETKCKSVTNKVNTGENIVRILCGKANQKI